MAITVTPATPTQPAPPGNRRRWYGTLTLDGASYVNGTGWTIPAASFGLANVDFCQVGLATAFSHSAVFLSGGANLVMKVMVEATSAELATNGGTGLVFPIEVVGC